MHNARWVGLKYDILKTAEFDTWVEQQQPKVRTVVKARLDLVSIGHFDHKRFEGLIELRWRNGIRIYTFIWNSIVVVIINGGNKNGQNRDIKKAKKIKDEIVEGLYSIRK